MLSEHLGYIIRGSIAVIVLFAVYFNIERLRNLVEKHIHPEARKVILLCCIVPLIFLFPPVLLALLFFDYISNKNT